MIEDSDSYCADDIDEFNAYDLNDWAEELDDVDWGDGSFIPMTLEDAQGKVIYISGFDPKDFVE